MKLTADEQRSASVARSLAGGVPPHRTAANTSANNTYAP
jgi:hypothetical protein